MPTYEVRVKGPALVSVTVEADDVPAACREAWELLVDHARGLNAADFEVTRQPSTPDDSGDARSEARYEQTSVDDESERIERERWGLSAESEETS